MDTLVGVGQLAEQNQVKDDKDLEGFLCSFLEKLERRLKEWRLEDVVEDKQIIPKPPSFSQGQIEIIPPSEGDLNQAFELRSLSGERIGCFLLCLKEDEGLYTVLSGGCSLVCDKGRELGLMFKFFPYRMPGEEKDKTGIEFTAVTGFRRPRPGKWWREVGF